MKIIRVVVVILIVAMAIVGISFMKVKPSEIAYTLYNEMHNAYRMYYVDMDGITIDTEPDRDLLMAKRKAVYTKKCNTEKLIVNVPLIMLFDWRKTIGEPSSQEQGGIILEYTLLGITKRFNLDPLQTIKYFPQLNEEVFNKIKLIDEEMASSQEVAEPSIQIGS